MDKLNEYTFNSLLVLQLFLLWIGGMGRVGYQKPRKLTGRVGSCLEIWTRVQLRVVHTMLNGKRP